MFCLRSVLSFSMNGQILMVSTAYTHVVGYILYVCNLYTHHEGWFIRILDSFFLCFCLNYFVSICKLLLGKYLKQKTKFFVCLSRVFPPSHHPSLQNFTFHDPSLLNQGTYWRKINQGHQKKKVWVLPLLSHWIFGR